MDLVSENNGDYILIRVNAERIDAAAAIQFKDAIRPLLSDAEGRVVLDLGKVQFVDSSGLGAFVSVMKMLGNDRRLELMGLTPNVEKVFRLTRMDRVFVIHGISDLSVGHDAA